MGVEEQLLAGVVGVGLVDPEDLFALRMQGAVRDEIIDRPARQERRIQLKQRLRPQRAVIQGSIDLRLDARVGDLDEAARVARVVLYESAAEIKDVHGRVGS